MITPKEATASDKRQRWSERIEAEIDDLLLTEVASRQDIVVYNVKPNVPHQIITQLIQRYEDHGWRTKYFVKDRIVHLQARDMNV